MAIVFGFADDDIEPINWLERIDLVEEALWQPVGVTEALVFFDASKLDLAGPRQSVEPILAEFSNLGCVRIEQWGYLSAADELTRRSIAKLELECDTSPLLRGRYGAGELVVAMFSIASLFESELEDTLRRHPGCLDIVLTGGTALQLLDPSIPDRDTTQP